MTSGVADMLPISLLIALAWVAVSPALALADQLPSWRDGSSKKAIVSFVERVTTNGSPDFVPTAERIAAFDNDGTLWAEQPAYFQLLFASRASMPGSEMSC